MQVSKLFEPKKIGETSLGGKVVSYFFLIVWAIIVIFPIYWLFITSFKLPEDVKFYPTYLPWIDFNPSLHAWENILFGDSEDTYHSYFNSIIISFFSTILSIIVGSLAAYALARIKYTPNFRTIFLFVMIMASAFVIVGKYSVDWSLGTAVGLVLFYFLWRALLKTKISFVLKSITLIAFISTTCFLYLSANINSFFEENGQVLASIMLFMTLGVGVFFFIKGKIGNADILFWIISQRILPPVVVVLPVYIMFQRIGLLDTHIAMILTYAVVNLPIVVWLIHDFVLTIPIDLEESAQLDGASRLYIFWDIILPLCKQGLAATTLLILILSWNEYLLASFLSTSKAQTLPIMVSAQITQDRGILWWNMCVVIIIMIIPVITMAFFLQKFITKGVLLGAVKG